ncbi:MAG: ferritin-like domain-containing protein [Janthinobacterium lividum]
MNPLSNKPLLAVGKRAINQSSVNDLNRPVPGLSRRGFVTSVGLTVGAVGAFGLSGCSDSSPSSSTPTDPTSTAPSVVDVLNFALNLEYLEASFYSYIATGSGLSSADLGSGAGTITPAMKVTFSNSAVNTVAQNLAMEEIAHVQFLRSTITAIGGTPVSAPALNLAAMGAVTSDSTFLALARQLEAVGVSAYAGGAQYLTSNTMAITYAAQILDTEAQHEGNLRQLCIQLGVTSPAADSLDMPPTSSQLFNTSNTTGLNPIRTTSQVLQIVYGTAGKSGVASGGFFPSGLNGNIKTS